MIRRVVRRKRRIHRDTKRRDRSTGSDESSQGLTRPVLARHTANCGLRPTFPAEPTKLPTVFGSLTLREQVQGPECPRRSQHRRPHSPAFDGAGSAPVRQSFHTYRRLVSMKWNIILGSMVLSGLVPKLRLWVADRMLGSNGCGCETSCCESKCCKPVWWPRMLRAQVPTAVWRLLQVKVRQRLQQRLCEAACGCAAAPRWLRSHCSRKCGCEARSPQR
jgi:hypothetical protein